MKSNSIRTYWAKDIKIEAIYGNKLEFAVNIKNKNGSNYVFPEGHTAFFGVYKATPFGDIGRPLESIFTSSEYYTFNTTIQDGKITISAIDTQLDLNALYAKPGLYNYVLFTYDPEDAGAGFINALVAQNDVNDYLNVEYIHPEAEGIFTLQSTILNGVGYYHEWYLLPGDDNLEAYCTFGAPAPLQANTYEGQSEQQYLLSYPLNNMFYADSANMWQGNYFLYQPELSEMQIIVGIQQENIVKCAWPTTLAGTSELLTWYLNIFSGSLTTNTIVNDEIYDDNSEYNFSFNTGNVPTISEGDTGPSYEEPTEQYLSGSGYTSPTFYLDFSDVPEYLSPPSGSNLFIPSQTNYSGLGLPQQPLWFGFLPTNESYLELIQNSPVEFINTMISYEEPEGTIPFTQELYDEYIDDEGVLPLPYNTEYFPTGTYNPAFQNTYVRIEVNASIVNAGNINVFQNIGYDGEDGWNNMVQSGQNTVKVIYGIEYVDTGETITEEVSVPFEPIFYSEEGDNYFPDITIYNNLQTSLPQNVNVNLDFNEILTQVTPSSEIRFFFRFSELVSVLPYLTNTLTETIFGTQTVVIQDQITEIQEVPIYGTETQYEIDFSTFEDFSIEAEGEDMCFDITVNEGDLSVPVGGNFKLTDVVSDYWNVDTLLYQEGMSFIDLSIRTIVEKFTWINYNYFYTGTSTGTPNPNYPNGEYYLDSEGKGPALSNSVGWNNGYGGTVSSFTIYTLIIKNLTTGEEFESDEVVDNDMGTNLFGFSNKLLYSDPWKRNVDLTDDTNEVISNVRNLRIQIPEGFASQNDELQFYFNFGTLSSRRVGGVSSKAGQYGYLDFDELYPEGGTTQYTPNGNSDAPIEPDGYPAVLRNKNYGGAQWWSMVDIGVIENTGEFVDLNHPQFYVETNIPQEILDVRPQMTDDPVHYTYTKERFAIKAVGMSINWTGNPQVATEVEVITGYEEQEVIIQEQITEEQQTETIQTTTVPVLSNNSYIANVNTTASFRMLNIYNETTLEQYGGDEYLLGNFKYTFKLQDISAQNTENFEPVTLAQWEQTASLLDSNGNLVADQMNYTQWLYNLSFDDFSVQPGAKLQITVEPSEEFRRYNNDEEGWMRVTKTNLSAAWKNYSYFSEELYPQVPSNLDFWLFGDFVIKKTV